MTKMNWGRVRQENNMAKYGSKQVNFKRKKKKKNELPNKLILSRPVDVFWPHSDAAYTFKNVVSVGKKFQASSHQVVGAIGCGTRITQGPLKGLLLKWNKSKNPFAWQETKKKDAELHQEFKDRIEKDE